MSTAVKQYFSMAFQDPLLRARMDRQSKIGRTVQSLLLGGLAFGMYSAIVGWGLGLDPIDVFKNTEACHFIAIGMGTLALGYIVLGKKGEREFRTIVRGWIAGIQRQATSNAAKETIPGETEAERQQRITGAGNKAIDDRLEQYGMFLSPSQDDEGDDDDDEGHPTRGTIVSIDPSYRIDIGNGNDSPASFSFNYSSDSVGISGSGSDGAPSAVGNDAGGGDGSSLPTGTVTFDIRQVQPNPT